LRITLNWARQELALAERGISDEERHASQAIIHAQCTVECLLDTYLERDWLTEKLPPKAGFIKKVEFLSKRPALQLPEKLLSRFVAEPRHSIIHRYQSYTATEARIVIEAASTIIASLKANSDPHIGKVFAGTLLGGYAGGQETYHWFTGFSGPFGFTWHSANGVIRVAAGIVSGEADAEVWWAPLQNFSIDQHFELLAWWDSVPIETAMRSNDLNEQLTLAGLNW